MHVIDKCVKLIAQAKLCFSTIKQQFFLSCQLHAQMKKFEKLGKKALQPHRVLECILKSYSIVLSLKA